MEVRKLNNVRYCKTSCTEIFIYTNIQCIKRLYYPSISTSGISTSTNDGEDENISLTSSKILNAYFL